MCSWHAIRRNSVILVARRFSSEAARYGPRIPFAVLNVFAWLRIIAALLAMGYLVRSGLRPRSGDPKAWYDRAIRVVGGIMIAVGLVYILLLDLLDER